ncbi:hypothetical protein GCM10022630_31210 [Thermobifida alba]|uniref:hypothetical protein n=1 Tax=Thermobifida alba TaxID=53522 RepID=UPI0031ED5AF2
MPHPGDENPSLSSPSEEGEARAAGGADTAHGDIISTVYRGDHVDQRDAQAQRDVIGQQVNNGPHFYLYPEPPAPPMHNPALREALGRPIGQCDPHDLEVHPALQAPSVPGAAGSVPRRDAARLPVYVRRAHDEELASVVEDAARGRSRMAVLVGSSSTGKTRACWEAIQPLAERGWRLWHPVDPTRAEAALADLDHITPHTVVWLNEAQHYLGAGGGTGERVATALHTLLTDPDRAPVLVLGTLWLDYAHTYTQRPDPGQPDVHAQARALLAGRLIHVPDAFDQTALAEAHRHAKTGDGQWAHALELSRQGRVAQVLAGGPALLERYQTAPPAARALLEAAMDARRLGAGLHLPQEFLVEAAEDYLTDDELAVLDDDWIDHSLVYTGQPVHGNLAPLRRVRPRRSQTGPASGTAGPVYRLADYLEQHGRHHRRDHYPPASFWQAAHRHLTTPDELHTLAKAAHRRGLLKHAVRLYHRAILAHHPLSAHGLVNLLSSDTDPHNTGAHWTATHAPLTDPGGVAFLLEALHEVGREEAVRELLARNPAAHVDLTAPGGVAFLLRVLHEVGREEAVRELLARNPAAHVDLTAPGGVAFLLEALRQAGQAGAVRALLARNPAAHVDLTAPGGVAFLLRVLHEVGREEAVRALLARNPAAHAPLTDPYGVARLLEVLHGVGREEAVQALASRTAAHAPLTHPDGVARLLEVLHGVGREEAVQALASRTAAHAPLTHPDGVARLLRVLHGVGREEAVQALASRTAAHAPLTDPYGVARLLEALRQAGQAGAVERLQRRALDAGALGRTPAFLQPYGREPDGTPAAAWTWEEVVAEDAPPAAL